MTVHFRAMQFTLREWREVGALWLGLTGLATLAGPFGTMDALSLLPRAVYWGGVISGAIMLHFALRRVQQHLPAHPAIRAAVSVAYAIILGGLVFGLNVVLFPGWRAGNIAGFLWLVMIVLVVAGAIHVLMIWLRPPNAPDQGTSAADIFVARLPLQKRGPLIRLEAQDHYLLVVTRNGSELILMRMADAEAALQDAGIRVHRSHWVMPDAILRVERRQGRAVLCMVDGADVPVSRSNLPALRAAGLLPA